MVKGQQATINLEQQKAMMAFRNAQMTAMMDYHRQLVEGRKAQEQDKAVRMGLGQYANFVESGAKNPDVLSYWASVGVDPNDALGDAQRARAAQYSQNPMGFVPKFPKLLGVAATGGTPSKDDFTYPPVLGLGLGAGGNTGNGGSGSSVKADSSSTVGTAPLDTLPTEPTGPASLSSSLNLAGLPPVTSSGLNTTLQTPDLNVPSYHGAQINPFPTLPNAATPNALDTSLLLRALPKMPVGIPNLPSAPIPYAPGVLMGKFGPLVPPGPAAAALSLPTRIPPILPNGPITGASMPAGVFPPINAVGAPPTTTAPSLANRFPVPPKTRAQIERDTTEGNLANIRGADITATQPSRIARTTTGAEQSAAMTDYLRGNTGVSQKRVDEEAREHKAMDAWRNSTLALAKKSETDRGDQVASAQQIQRDALALKGKIFNRDGSLDAAKIGLITAQTAAWAGKLPDQVLVPLRAAAARVHTVNPITGEPQVDTDAQGDVLKILNTIGQVTGDIQNKARSLAPPVSGLKMVPAGSSASIPIGAKQTSAPSTRLGVSPAGGQTPPAGSYKGPNTTTGQAALKALGATPDEIGVARAATPQQFQNWSKTEPNQQKVARMTHVRRALGM